MNRYSNGKAMLLGLLAILAVLPLVRLLEAEEAAVRQAVGRDDFHLDVRLLDDATLKPLAGFSLRLISPLGAWCAPQNTDAQGKARLEGPIANADLAASSPAAVFDLVGWLLEATGPGYITKLVPLSDLIPGLIPLETRFTLPHQEVHLLKEGTNQALSQRPTEHFVREDRWGRHIDLYLYEGRFHASMVAGVHGKWFRMKAGSVVENTKGLLALHAERGKVLLREDAPETDDWHVDELARLNWKGRLYLIGSKQWVSFCNAVNQGEEPCGNDYGEFFLRSGDNRIEVDGLPSVPELWNNYLLRDSIRAQVVEITSDGDALINVGSDSSLRAGMELLPLNPRDFSDQIVIKSEPGRSLIKTKYPKGRYRRIAIGDVVVSKQPSN